MSKTAEATSVDVDVDQLVTEGLPLVRAVVGGLAHHYPRHCDRDELVAAGASGLVEAARRFDPGKGVPFDRWAALRIRGAVVDAVRACDFAPRALRSSARDLAAVRSTLERELGRTPTSAEVADRMGLSLSDLVGLEGRLHRSTVLRLDAPTGEDAHGTTLGSVVVDPGVDPLEELERRERDSYVVDALHSLPDRLRAVLVGGFLEGRSSAELADRLGVTESRVSQMRTEALTLVREGLAAQYGERTRARTGRAAARQAAYDCALSRRSSYAARLSVAPRPCLVDRLAG